MTTETPETPVIFDITQGDWRVVATRPDIGSDAHLEFTRNGEAYRDCDYPAYRVWNIAAHFQDIIADFEAEDGAGARAAGEE